MTTNDEQYREALGYYTRGRDEGYPLNPDLIIGEGGGEYRAAFDRFLARVRRDAQREAYTTARSVLAGEDTVEWARGAHSSSMSYPHAIGIMDDLIEDLDEEVSP